MSSVQGEKIGYIVPTKDRPDDLRKLLVSLAAQTVMPEQIVIVDGGDAPIGDLVAEFSALPLTYVREYPPSLARQRNAGVAALHPEITIAGYLDDDLELAPDATEQMQAFWAGSGPEVGGAAFTIVNQPMRGRLSGLLSDFFLLNSRVQGKVLASGFASSILPRTETLATDWLYGGATLWRRAVFETYFYDEWYIGHGYLEDLDYSHRVAQEYTLYVLAEARCWHWPSPVRMAQNETLGRQQILNRIYFTRKIGHFNRVAFLWAMFGQSVKNLLETVITFSPAGWLRFKGNLRGLYTFATKGVAQIGGIWK